MLSFVQFMGNDQLINRFKVWDLQSKELLEWLDDADIFPAREIFLMITDKLNHRAQGKSGIAQQLKAS